MEILAVERTIWIAAPPERVWRAITDAEQLGRWWPPDEWKIPSLQLGGTVQFGADNDEETAFATIEVLDPPRQFTLQWQPNPMFPVTTMVTTLVLTEDEGGTRLTVTESGFEALPEGVRQKRMEGTAEGYTSVLADLKTLLERETP